MKNTEFTTENLLTMVSSEFAFNEMMGMINDLGLVITDVEKA